ncbi:helix-turn-helix domain-containing protein [Gottfriedia luciferensis]|uniref:helix-turn-helix domain-containing protein n=1 Tax=Gottfriedia luciferensis TaxID=178774 RepID=UPI00130256A9|nr:helix-turn-helix transcriptional regulator [Gottfriedia luciferensis]
MTDQQSKQNGKNKLGEIISILRKQKQMTYRDLESLTGITPSYINRIERGDRGNPSYSIIQKLAIALEVNEQILLNAISGDENTVNTNENKLQIKSFSDVITETILMSSFSLCEIEATIEIKEKLVSTLNKMEPFILNPNRKSDFEILVALDELTKIIKDNNRTSI